MAFTIPDHVMYLILEEGYCTDVIKQFTNYCMAAALNFRNYDKDDTPEHLWEAYEAGMYPYRIFMSDGDRPLLRFAQHSNDLERDVLPDCPGWRDYEDYPLFEHP